MCACFCLSVWGAPFLRLDHLPAHRTSPSITLPGCAIPMRTHRSRRGVVSHVLCVPQFIQAVEEVVSTVKPLLEKHPRCAAVRLRCQPVAC